MYNISINDRFPYLICPSVRLTKFITTRQLCSSWELHRGEELAQPRAARLTKCKKLLHMMIISNCHGQTAFSNTPLQSKFHTYICMTPSYKIIIIIKVQNINRSITKVYAKRIFHFSVYTLTFVNKFYTFFNEQWRKSLIHIDIKWN